MDTATPIVTLRSIDGNKSYTFVGTGRKVAQMLMTGLDLEAVSSKFEKKQGDIQACDWHWNIIYNESGTMTIQKPLQQPVSLSTSNGSLTKAYAQHLHTTLHKMRDAKTLRAMALEHNLKTSGRSVIELKELLSTWFREQKHVEEEMNKFFAEPSDEGIENVT